MNEPMRGREGLEFETRDGATVSLRVVASGETARLIIKHPAKGPDARIWDAKAASISPTRAAALGLLLIRWSETALQKRRSRQPKSPPQ